MSAEPVILSLAIAAAAVIAVGSLWRGDSPALAWVPQWLPPVWHFFVYCLLAFLCVRALETVVTTPAPRAAAGFLLATGFGALLEYLQKFRIARYARISDVLINASGAALGSWIALG